LSYLVCGNEWIKIPKIIIFLCAFLGGSLPLGGGSPKTGQTKPETLAKWKLCSLWH